MTNKLEHKGLTMHLVLITGTRPNLVKAKGIYLGLKSYMDKHLTSNSVAFKLTHVHLGQHFDDKLYSTQVASLELPDPIMIELGSSSLSVGGRLRVGYSMLSQHLMAMTMDAVIVVGDVFTTAIGSMAALRLNIPIIHYESGLRSDDFTMPEELNRVFTDIMSTYHICTTSMAADRLIQEGHDPQKIFTVGNLMIDTLVHTLHKGGLEIEPLPNRRPYIVMTLHRLSIRKSREEIKAYLQQLIDHCDMFDILFIAHPAIWPMVNETLPDSSPIQLKEALPYRDFIQLVRCADGVITDSGGLSEECTYLDIPCITLRAETERLETIQFGTNVLCDVPEKLPSLVHQIKVGHWKKSQQIPGYDGHAGLRLFEKLAEIKRG